MDICQKFYLRLDLTGESNDCENAVLFWGELEEEVVTDELRKEFYKLLKRCKYDVPQGLNVKMS